MASESPYEKQGQPLETPTPQRSVGLNGGLNETPYTVSHKGSGEWRFWRDMLEANGVLNPFDMRDMVPAGPLTGAVEPAELDGVDPFEELDQTPEWVYSSIEVPSVVLTVEDVAAGYEITAKVPGGTYGAATLIPPDRLTEDTVVVPVILDDDAVEFEFTSGGWLIFWLSRTVTLASGFGPTRTLLLIPG